MPRTRDLFLVGVIVLFLLSAIGLTWWQQLARDVSDVATAWLGYETTVSVPASTTAIVVNEVAENRPARLAAMQERVAAELGVPRSVPETTAPTTASGASDTPTEPEVVAIEEESTQADAGVQLCPNYTLARVAWSPHGILFQESEGVRVVFRDVTDSTPVDLADAQLERTVLAQLPLRQFPLPTTQCLPTDVIGIAQDGSLIRNNEVALYGIFRAETVIGYALDGFPIHGANPGAPVDSCGGMVVDGQYRYYLDNNRDGLINCFAGIPVTL